MKNPPVLISLLGFFSLLAGFAYVFFGLRVIGFDWFGALGDLPAFEHVGLWGWLAVATGAIWILVALGLWTLQPWARLFALFMAGFALLEAVIAMFQFTGSGIGFAMALMPILIIWYLSTAEVKAVFAEGDETSAAPNPAPESMAAPVAFAAAAASRADSTRPCAHRGSSGGRGRGGHGQPRPGRGAGRSTGHGRIGPCTRGRACRPPHEDRGRRRDRSGLRRELAAIGIATTSDLLEAGAKPYARERIAEQTGISSKLIRDWVNKVDLMRVPGVGPQYSDLLEAAGVDSPGELAQRNPTNLAITIQEVVAERPGIVRRLPTESEIAAWVGGDTLDSAVEH